jgi:peptidase S41-like protein
MRRLFAAFAALLLLSALSCSGNKAPQQPEPNVSAGAKGSLPAAFTTPQDLAVQPAGIETVRVAYNLLMDKYYKPLKSNDLLRAAWDGAVQEVSREGGTSSGSAPAFSGDHAADFKAFSDGFNSLVLGADRTKCAFAAVEGMTRSLHDDHTAFLSPEAYREFGIASSNNTARDVFSTKMLPNGVGYMKLSQFPAGYQKLADGKVLSEAIDAALNNFESQDAQGWILDLRNNGGGHTESISTVTGRFIVSGVEEIDVDSKGQRFEVPVDGHYFSHQHPLAVLINGGSGSASEITAAAIKDYGAGRLFGSKTAGAVNGAEIFPLPGQVGLEYTVVQVLAGKSGKPLDRAGVEPDEVVSPQAGRDAQLEAAQAWLNSGASHAISGSPQASAGALSSEQLRSQLSPYEPAVADIPPLPNLRMLGDITLDNPNQFVVWSPCATDATQLAKSAGNRGWQGEYDQFFGNGDPFTYEVGIDIYRDAGGAEQALHANDCPPGLQIASLPVHAGDESVALKGIGVLQGWTLLRWRHGRLVFSAYYYSEPGLESFDPLVQISKAVENRYEAKPFK